MGLAAKNRAIRVIANFALFTPLVLLLIVGGRLLQRMNYPTEITYTHIEQSPPYHAGDVIDVAFRVTRWRTCQLQLDRIFERIDDLREFRAATVTQLIEKDTPAFARETGYRVQIPSELKPGKYHLFTRFRYYCIALDSVIPWIRRSPSIELEIVP